MHPACHCTTFTPTHTTVIACCTWHRPVGAWGASMHEAVQHEAAVLAAYRVAGAPGRWRHQRAYLVLRRGQHLPSAHQIDRQRLGRWRRRGRCRPAGPAQRSASDVGRHVRHKALHAGLVAGLRQRACSMLWTSALGLCATELADNTAGCSTQHSAELVMWSILPVQFGFASRRYEATSMPSAFLPAARPCQCCPASWFHRW